jgi:hypothetical protein
MTIRLYAVYFFAVLAVAVSCDAGKDDDQPDVVCTYCACCETTPLSDSFQAGGAIARVYIPNMVVLGSSDVANANFAVFANDAVEKIVSIKLLDLNGNLLFGGADLPVNQPVWDAVISTDVSGAPNTYDGSFEYIIAVRAVGGLTKTYTGSACVVQCGNADDLPSANLQKCGFPSQNSAGAFGGGTPAVAQECF